MQLVVTKGTVQYNGEIYPAGKPLPEGISKEDAERLLRLDVVADGYAALIASQERIAIPVPIVDGIPHGRQLNGQVGDPVSIDFNPDENIRGARRG